MAYVVMHHGFISHVIVHVVADDDRTIELKIEQNLGAEKLLETLCEEAEINFEDIKKVKLVGKSLILKQIEEIFKKAEIEIEIE